jgi:hypothetical protein
VSKSGTDTCNASASTSSVLNVTLRSQRSIEPMYVRCNSHRSANPSCESPCFLRYSRTLVARILRKFELALRTAAGFHNPATWSKLADYGSTDYK